MIHFFQIEGMEFRSRIHKILFHLYDGLFNLKVIRLNKIKTYLNKRKEIYQNEIQIQNDFVERAKQYQSDIQNNVDFVKKRKTSKRVWDLDKKI